MVEQDSDAIIYDADMCPSSLRELGHRIAAVCKEIGSQKDAADFFGIPIATLGRYIRGVNNPPVTAISRIAALSHVNLDWLITGKEPMRPGMAQKDTGLTFDDAMTAWTLIHRHEGLADRFSDDAADGFALLFAQMIAEERKNTGATPEEILKKDMFKRFFKKK
ncbi:MAG: helix-turn-helix transcriptional regulator [Magnetococcales bacterium]|nr:helix-turn-helix transcriptional regulator [Magnetococcales bacterium]